MKTPYLLKRGRVYQFSRRVPDDIRAVLGIDHWRTSLKTDSEVEATIACRAKAVETDQVISAVRGGTFRHFDNAQIDDFAVRWSIQFQMINQEFIPIEAFPSAFPQDVRIGDEAASALFKTRADLELSVRKWVEAEQIDIIDSAQDWSSLLDACLDEYLTANPEISDDWVQIVAERGLNLSRLHQKSPKVIERKAVVHAGMKLSAVFKDYLDNVEELGTSAQNDFGVSVRRFIEFHGDLDVNAISRIHVEDFRNALRYLPSRPPNNVRSLPFPKQVAWANGREVKRLSQSAINKNLLGVKLALAFAFEETSKIADRNWRNPFDGFIKKPKRSKNPIGPFQPEQLRLIFSRDVYLTKTQEKFWIPLILFYTGARLDEISQLHCVDIRLDPVPHIVSENLDDEDPALAKKLKTVSSHRTIPLHLALIELGFLDYVGATRAAGHIHLFPNLPHKNVGKRGNLVSRDFIERFRKYGKSYPDSKLNSKSLVTHSLRHSFRSVGFIKLEQEFVQIVMGHYVEGESIQTYGHGIYQMPDILAERVINRIQLPELDMDYLRAEAKRYLTLIT